MKIVSVIIFLFAFIFVGDAIAKEKCEKELQDVLFDSNRSKDFLNYARVETDGYLKCIAIFPEEKDQQICRKIKISAEGMFLAYSVMIVKEESSRKKMNTCLFEKNTDL